MTDADAGRPGAQPPENPWRVLQRAQDRHRYLRLLEDSADDSDQADAVITDASVEGTYLAGGYLDLDASMSRADHHLLRSPAAMTRTAAHHPDPEHAEHYLAHSADLTMRGGIAAALTYPLAACSLAEHYVFRRIGGSSAAALSAAATAAAELGRTSGTPTEPVIWPSVEPGYAGLAQMIGWLTGQDGARPGAVGKELTAPLPHWPERQRLARMFRPAPATRPLYRTLVATWRSRERTGLRRRWLPVLASLFAAPSRGVRTALLMLWLGALLGWLGVTAMLNRLELPLVALTSAMLAITFAVAAAAVTALAYLAAVRDLLGERSEVENFGLIPGVDLPDMRPETRGLASRLDRWAGLPGPGDTEALITWAGMRIDDLAGVPRGADPNAATEHDARRALTFGELWLGRLGPASASEAAQLRRAAADPQHRVIDLVLTATDVSQGRPYRLPFATAEQAERTGASRFLFCRKCLGEVLPVRVVTQMLLDSPAQARESTCPRHAGEVLHEVPDPWDFPVLAAVRMSVATTPLLRAVPLFTLDRESPAAVQDGYGRVMGPTPAPGSVYVPRVQWFADGGLTSGMPADAFDTLLPRWPTFALTLEHLVNPPVTEGPHELADWVGAPEQDDALRAPSWRRLAGLGGFAAAMVSTSATWRDAMQADLPGFRGRIASVRLAYPESGAGIFLPQRTILSLALRGFHAGQRLRERFAGPDGDVATQTQTDRYRWIRMRMALREYRRMSLEIGVRLPVYGDLAATYQVPGDLCDWFSPPLKPGTVDPAWPDAAAAITHLRALSAGGVLDWDADYGAAPVEHHIKITPEGG